MGAAGAAGAARIEGRVMGVRSCIATLAQDKGYSGVAMQDLTPSFSSF